MIGLYEVDFMRIISSVSPSDLALAKEFARRLGEHVASQLFQVTLFGSRARNAADEEFDLDLSVTL